MAFLLFDQNLFETLQVHQDTEKTAVLTENFKWLIRNLQTFDPSHQTDRHPVWGRGKRRIVRADKSKSLGYQYQSYSKSAKITNKGNVVDKSFGFPINLEKWEVRAPWPVHDTTPGSTEVYKGPKTGDHYTCYVTSRADLRDKKRTRCFVSCNCSDFRYSFMQDLIDKGYTKEPADGPLPDRGSGKTGKIQPHTAAICKHLYAIINNFYSDYVKTETSATQSPDLFVTKGGEVPTRKPLPTEVTPVKKPTTKPTVQPPVKPVAKKPPTKTEIKDLARQAIIQALSDADTVADSNIIDSYIDSRKFSKSAHASAHVHKYKFWVKVETNDGKGSIYFVNAKAGGSNSGQKLVTVPKHSKTDSYYLFSPKELHDLIQQYTTERPKTLDKTIARLQKTNSVMFFESVLIDTSDELKLLAETSDIKRCLNFITG